MRLDAALPLIAAAAVTAGTLVENTMRPTASVGGAYGLVAAVDPSPKPKTDGCVDGCPCNGSGEERSGDGIITFPCRCPSDCECKGDAESCCEEEEPAGVCPLPSASSGGCTSGNCPTSAAPRRRGLFGRWR